MSHLAFRNVNAATGEVIEFHIGGEHDGWYVGVVEGDGGIGSAVYTRLRLATVEESEWHKREFWNLNKAPQAASVLPPPIPPVPHAPVM